MEKQLLEEYEKGLDERNETKAIGLKRDVGLLSGIALIIGTMIGTHMYCT